MRLRIIKHIYFKNYQYYVQKKTLFFWYTLKITDSYDEAVDYYSEYLKNGSNEIVLKEEKYKKNT